MRSPPGLKVFNAKVPASRRRDVLNLFGLRVHRDALHLQAPLLIRVLRRPKAASKSSSLELAQPFSTHQMKTPFYAPFLRKGVWKYCLSFQKCPPQGLATLPRVCCQPSFIFGSLFQLPAPVGFTLQSFPLSNESKQNFFRLVRSCASLENHNWPSTGASSISSPLESRPHHAPQRFSLGWRPCFLEYFGPLRFSIPAQPTFGFFLPERFSFSLLSLQLLAKLNPTRLKDLSRTDFSISRLLGR